MYQVMLPLSTDTLQDTAMPLLMLQSTVPLQLTNQLQSTSQLQFTSPLQYTNQPHLTTPHPIKNLLMLMFQLNINTNTQLLMIILVSTLEPTKLVMVTQLMVNTVLPFQIVVPK